MSGRWADRKPREIEVTCEIDGVSHSFTTWTDLSALLALRLNALTERPRRGCEAGQCGACTSHVNGLEVRICQLPATALQGAVVVTGNN